MADLTVGEASRDVAHDFQLGWGQAVPAAGWVFSFAPGPANVGDRLLGCQCGAGGERGVVALRSECLSDDELDGGLEFPVRGKIGHVLLLIVDRDICVINATTGELLRELVLDPARDYQPLGRKPSPTKQKPPTH